MLDERASTGRRAFIALGAGAILGGCVQGGTSGGSGTGKPTATQSESPRPTADSRTETDSPATEDGNVTIGIGSEKNEPQTTEAIGGTTGNVDDEDVIMVWNDAGTARQITVTVAERAASGKPPLQETYRFEPDAYVTIDVQEAGEYVVTVSLDGDDPETVDFSADDCNDQSLFITVMEDGAVESNGMSTMMLCTTLTMTSTGDG
jgi:hypothetical protein